MSYELLMPCATFVRCIYIRLYVILNPSPVILNEVKNLRINSVKNLNYSFNCILRPFAMLRVTNKGL
jgi:hypothetical protein